MQRVRATTTIRSSSSLEEYLQPLGNSILLLRLSRVSSRKASNRLVRCCIIFNYTETDWKNWRSDFHVRHHLRAGHGTLRGGPAARMAGTLDQARWRPTCLLGTYQGTPGEAHGTEGLTTRALLMCSEPISTKKHRGSSEMSQDSCFAMFIWMTGMEWPSPRKT